MYGVPYMTASASRPFDFSFTLRGFSPRELDAQAERECRKHFGECAWKIEEATCAPCMGTLGGRVRLYEARIVATATVHQTDRQLPPRSTPPVAETREPC